MMQAGAPTSAARPAAPAPRMRSAVVLVSGSSRPRRRAVTGTPRTQQPTITLGERAVRQPTRQAPTRAPMSAAPRIVTMSTQQRAARMRRAPRGRAARPIAALRAAAQHRAPTTTSEEEEE
jgi:hypothetical protein